MRRRWLKGAGVAAALAVAGPAAGNQPSPGPVLRTEIGFGNVSWGGCSVRSIDTCDWSSFSGSGLAVLGVTHDSPIGSTPNLSAGGRFLYWEAGGSRHVEVEPTLGVTWKFPLAAWGEARLHAGGGLSFGTEFGLALRFGGGMGVSVSQGVSLGFDLMVEAGILGSDLNMTSSVTLGPAFRL
ncbi:MAG TPA: hypothetical protein VFI16_01710, partial [Anaeromyxobacteraceae bacterium]|nr:hypothetical protein [Anaeromyxobacteraceae bacterium]